MSPRRRALGGSPLDAVEEMAGGERADAQPGRRGGARPPGRAKGSPSRPGSTGAVAGQRGGRPSQPARRARKVPAPFHISADLLEECRDAAVALSGPPVRLTLAGLAESALRRELDRLKRRHGGGADFPPRRAQLRPGRPIDS